MTRPLAERPDDIVGVAEIAQRLGVSKQVVVNYRSRHAGFPEPAERLAMGPIYDWQLVRSWAESRDFTPAKN